jgi:hypothetical protein
MQDSADPRGRIRLAVVVDSARLLHKEAACCIGFGSPQERIRLIRGGEFGFPLGRWERRLSGGATQSAGQELTIKVM